MVMQVCFKYCYSSVPVKDSASLKDRSRTDFHSVFSVKILSEIFCITLVSYRVKHTHKPFPLKLREF